MNILIIGPAWIGDMVMSHSLYISLKEQYPESKIDILAPQWCLPLVKCMPEINQAIPMPIGHGDFNLLERYRLGKSLRKSKYDWAIILPNSAKSALIPLFAKIPKRTGWRGEMRYGLLNDIRIGKKTPLMVQRYLSLAYSADQLKRITELTVDQIRVPKLSIDPTTQNATIQKFHLPFAPSSHSDSNATSSSEDSTHQRIIGICPGAEYGPSKIWPTHYYAQLTQRLLNKGYYVCLFGAAKEQEICNEIYSALNIETEKNCFNFCGKTELLEAVELLNLCDLVVSNDSGLMHISSSLECRIVAIFGSTPSTYAPPLTHRQKSLQMNLDCTPCFQRQCKFGHYNCLNQITVDSVENAVDSLLKNR